ncbi:MAG: hypothetical protein V9G04_05820 [Nocardioides sp.]
MSERLETTQHAHGGSGFETALRASSTTGECGFETRLRRSSTTGASCLLIDRETRDRF